MRPFNPTRDRYPEFRRHGRVDLGDEGDLLLDDYLRRLRIEGESAAGEANATASEAGRRVLGAYVPRAAARAVRAAGRLDLVKDLLVQGAVACVLGGLGHRSKDALMDMSTLTDACRRTGVSLSEVAREAEDTLGRELSEGLRIWLRRTSRQQSLSAMAFEAVGSGESFRYRSTLGRERLGPTYIQGRQSGFISPEEASPRKFDEYRDAKLPSERDLALDSHIGELALAGKAAVSEAARRLDSNERTELWFYAQRAASRAVRAEDPKLLTLAVVALVLSTGGQLSTLPITMRVALVNDACERLGLHLDDLAENVAAIAGGWGVVDVVGNILAREEEDKTVECMGFEAGSDEDGFRYRWVG